MRLVGTIGSPEVMTLVAEVFCTLVEGELLQAGYIDTSLAAGAGLADTTDLPSVVQDPTKDEVVAALWREYLQKTYMKTASLFSRAMECCVILGGATAGEPWRAAAVSYGECLGMAFQVRAVNLTAPLPMRRQVAYGAVVHTARSSTTCWTSRATTGSSASPRTAT